MVGLLVERHYTKEGEKTTKNLPGIATKINDATHDMMVGKILVYANPPMERGLGQVYVKTRYYEFEGNNVFLEEGLAQVGRATTADNRDGFSMIRLFANSLVEMNALEKRCGL